MSYKVEDITKMIDAGFTADEIRALDTDGLFTYAGGNGQEPEAKEPEMKESEAKEPEMKESEGSDTIKELEETINKGFQSIINAFQVSAVGGSRQQVPEAKTSEAILAEIISPYGKPDEGGKK